MTMAIIDGSSRGSISGWIAEIVPVRSQTNLSTDRAALGQSHELPNPYRRSSDSPGLRLTCPRLLYPWDGKTSCGPPILMMQAS